MAVENIQAEDLRNLLRRRPEEVEIIDVRGKEEFEKVRIRGSKLISLEELPQRITEIDWDKEVVFVCRSGRRSQLVAGMAAASGAEVKNLRFGIYECFKDGEGSLSKARGVTWRDISEAAASLTGPSPLSRDESGAFRNPRSPGSGRRE